MEGRGCIVKDLGEIEKLDDKQDCTEKIFQSL